MLASCVDAVRSIGEGEIGEVIYGSQPVPPSKGSPLSPSATMTGHIEAMAMYASDATADVTAIRPAADVLSWLRDGVAATAGAALIQTDHDASTSPSMGTSAIGRARF